MNPPTDIAISGYYSKGDWEGYCRVVWTAPTQPDGADTFYRIESKGLDNSYTWITDVTPETSVYGVSILLATAPLGGSPKTRVAKGVRITAIDATTGDAADNSLDFPTDISMVHNAASDFAVVCNGHIGSVEGRLDFTWADLTRFIRRGRITLSKYGMTSPGIRRVLHEVEFDAVPSEYGPNRVSIPISLFPAGIFWPNPPSWDIHNPLSSDPLAPFWVVDQDILTLTITTSADDDPNPVTAEFTFQYHKEVDLSPRTEPAVVDTPYSQELAILEDPYFVVKRNFMVQYVSGLPEGGIYDEATRTIAGTFGLEAIGVYKVYFDVTSEGNKTNRQFVNLVVNPVETSGGGGGEQTVFWSNVNGAITRVVLSPDGAKAYVLHGNGGGTISVIDTDTMEEITNFAFGGTLGSEGIAISPDGSRLYIPNNGLRTVKVIDTDTYDVVHTIDMTASPSSGHNYPVNVAVTPDGAQLLVVSKFFPDEYNVYFYDTSTWALTGTVAVAAGCWDIRITPDGQFAYVTCQSANAVCVIDIATKSLLTTITTDIYISPIGIDMHPDGSKVYVATLGKLHTIDTATNTVVHTITNLVTNTIQPLVSTDGVFLFFLNYAFHSIPKYRTSDYGIEPPIRLNVNPFRGCACSPDSRFLYFTAPIFLAKVDLAFVVPEYVPPPEERTKPTINSAATFTAKTDGTNCYLITTDVVADYCRASGLPEGLFLGNQREIIGMPTALPGEYPATLNARNRWGWGPDFALTIHVESPVPEIYSPHMIDAVIGRPFFYKILATSHPNYFAADNLPPGLACDPVSGVISGVPTSVQAAYERSLPDEYESDDPVTFVLNHTVTLTAINEAGGAGTAQLAINIKTPPVPVIDDLATHGRAVTLQVNETFVFQPSASNHPTRWSAEPLPQGLSFDAATGRLSGQFVTNGFYGITFAASNEGGDSDPVTFYFMVGEQVLAEGQQPPAPRVPIDMVDLWVDLDTRLVSVGGPTDSKASLTVKRGDTTVVNVIFHRGGVPADIDLANLYFGAKTAFDEEYVVYSTNFRKLDIGKYRPYPDFSDQNNELDKVLSKDKATLIGEIQWDDRSLVRSSSQTFELIVLRDLLHPDPVLEAQSTEAGS